MKFKLVTEDTLRWLRARAGSTAQFTYQDLEGNLVTGLVVEEDWDTTVNCVAIEDIEAALNKESK